MSSKIKLSDSLEDNLMLTQSIDDKKIHLQLDNYNTKQKLSFNSHSSSTSNSQKNYNIKEVEEENQEEEEQKQELKFQKEDNKNMSYKNNQLQVIVSENNLNNLEVNTIHQSPDNYSSYTLSSQGKQNQQMYQQTIQNLQQTIEELLEDNENLISERQVLINNFQQLKNDISSKVKLKLSKIQDLESYKKEMENIINSQFNKIEELNKQQQQTINLTTKRSQEGANKIKQIITQINTQTTNLQNENQILLSNKLQINSPSPYKGIILNDITNTAHKQQKVAQTSNKKQNRYFSKQSTISLSEQRENQKMQTNTNTKTNDQPNLQQIYQQVQDIQFTDSPLNILTNKKNFAFKTGQSQFQCINIQKVDTDNNQQENQEPQQNQNTNNDNQKQQQTQENLKEKNSQKQQQITSKNICSPEKIEKNDQINNKQQEKISQLSPFNLDSESIENKINQQDILIEKSEILSLQKENKENSQQSDDNLTTQPYKISEIQQQTTLNTLNTQQISNNSSDKNQIYQKQNSCYKQILNDIEFQEQTQKKSKKHIKNKNNNQNQSPEKQQKQQQQQQQTPDQALNDQNLILKKKFTQENSDTPISSVMKESQNNSAHNSSKFPQEMNLNYDDSQQDICNIESFDSHIKSVQNSENQQNQQKLEKSMQTQEDQQELQKIQDIDQFLNDLEIYLNQMQDKYEICLQNKEENMILDKKLCKQFLNKNQRENYNTKKRLLKIINKNFYLKQQTDYNIKILLIKNQGLFNNIKYNTPFQSSKGFKSELQDFCNQQKQIERLQKIQQYIKQPLLL